MDSLCVSKEAGSPYAYVTLLANDAYLPGITALVNSLRVSDTRADIVVLYTEIVTSSELKPLNAAGCHLVKVALLDVSDAFKDRHERDRLHGNAPFTKGKKPVFHSPLLNFCKLRLWQLTNYERVIFLDGDTIVIRNIDRLFGYPEFSAAPNVYENLADFHRLNSGVFVAKPSRKTFEDMLEHLDQPGKFWKRTDQTFLQDYFPDWHGLPVFYNMLQYVWFNLPELWDWGSVHVIHYQYEKPWETGHARATQLKPLIDLWRAFYTGEDIPDLSSLPDQT